MLSEELLRKVRLIEITTRKRVDDVMSGQYKSSFKGHGVQFSEHRVYVAGDDVRHIDWKVSARSRDLLVKKFDEERELTMLLVVDVSGSKQFGSTTKVKAELTAEVAGMLAYAASHTGDKVGAILFAGEVENVLPPKKGRKHILRLISDLLTHSTRTRGTNLVGALESANRLMKHQGIVFVVSDFIGSGYEQQLKRLARRNDVVAITIKDPKEGSAPMKGRFLILDPESGQEKLVDFGSYAFRKWLEAFNRDRIETRKQAFKSGRIESIEISTEENFADALVRFFQLRARRRGR